MAEHLELVAEIPKVEKLTVQERLEYAKKRRAQQLKRWEREKDSDFGPPPRKKKIRNKPLTFEPQFMLLDAATRGDVDEVKSMLENGIDPNICNDDGLTALHQACIDGKDEIIDILLDYGAILDCVDRELWTPLHAATACGNDDIVEYLLDHGADIVAINADGNMPIDLAEDDEELREILEAEMEEQGYTKEKLMQLKEDEERRMLSDLKNELSTNSDMDLDQKNDQGATFVHITAANCYEDALEYLLEQGAAVDIPDKDGWQPIHAAAVWGNEQVIEMLVESGADLDAKTPRGETPLSLCEDPELQQFLVDLKNKVKANKAKSARRKRSNSRSLSVKRTSLKDKITISHNEAKAEAILRVHPQLAFLLPKGNEAKQQEQDSKAVDVTPASTEGQATQNSTTTANVPSCRQEIQQKDKTSSLTRPRGKENIEPVTKDVVAKDKTQEDSGTERKGSIKITVKTHTTTFDNKSKADEQKDKPRSPRARRSPREPQTDVIMTTSGSSDNKEGKSSSNQTSSTSCSLVSISTTSVPKATSVPGKIEVSKNNDRAVEYTEPKGRNGMEMRESSSLHHDSTSPRKPLVEKGSNSPSNIVGSESSLNRSKTKEESSIKNRTDENSNSKQFGDIKLSHSSKVISKSSDNIGPRLDSASTGTGSLPKSSKTRPAPPPPLPRSSGSLSRNHEPEDTSGYPDSFSKKSRSSRENILEAVASGRLGTPESKTVSSSDVNIEGTGRARYTPTKEPYSSHNRQPQQSGPSPNKPTTQTSNKSTNQPTNKQGVYTARYTKRDENDTISSDKVLYNDRMNVEREKKTCCLLM